MPEHALLRLRTRASADEWEETFFGPLGFPSMAVDEAIERIAAVPLSRFGVLQRLAVIHDLSSDKTELTHNAEATRLLISSTVGPDKEDQVWNTVFTLESDVSFVRFVEELQNQNLVSSRLKPVDAKCTTRRLTGGAVEIVASYETTGELKEFYFGANPLNWPVCNPFFRSVTRNGGSRSMPPQDNRNGQAFRSRVEEIVGVSDVLNWRTNLNVRYFVSNTAVGMDFDLAQGGDGQIDVDHGFVVAEQLPNKTVRVRSEKTVRFVNLPTAPAELACILGWVDMMQGMATCERGNLCDIVEDLTDVAESAFHRHTVRLERACREAAAGTYDVKDLARDSAGFWRQVVSDSARATVAIGSYMFDNLDRDHERNGS